VSWFEQPVTHAVLQAVFQLVKENRMIEPASVLSEIKRFDQDSSLTLDDLTHCMKLASNPANLLHHVCQIKDRAERQELRQIVSVIGEELDSDARTPAILDHAKWLLHGLGTDPKAGNGNVIDEIMTLYRTSAEGGYTGIPSRWIQLQRILGGYQRRGTTVLSGRSKMGKTTVACNETLYGATHGIRTRYVSLEMTEGELRALMAGDELDIDLFQLRNGVVKGQEREQQLTRLRECMTRQKELPIDIIDGSKNIEEIDSIIRGSAGEYDRIVIDHLHLIRHARRDPLNKEERLGHYSSTIKNSSNDANLNTLLLAQLSRDGLVDRQGNPLAPQPFHLKGSGSIEQDASQVVFVYQDPACGKELVPDKAPTIIKVAYNRFGPTGQAEFVFLKSRQKFISREVWDQCHEEYEAKQEQVEDSGAPF
jgi:replicative DNA helicase